MSGKFTRKKIDKGNVDYTRNSVISNHQSLENPECDQDDKLYENILMKMIALAPIEVEILLWRCSPQKIVTYSGISS
ncbi:hypothetical protein FLA105534_00712 [Flavobacterium bizetiae]|uniref:Uncharacterized protein n=1 Tax=Flavobacterium bizetiae TaxID=2704140 RepID=A0A6J4GBX9_9FLAO|nr:hypothetical protein FLA105534_00712 [Flavobacterium bizetiae]